MVKWRTQPKKCKNVKNFLHCMINPKQRFDRKSFRVKNLPRGRKLVIGCPKGKYSIKSKRCKVGTKAQKLLRPI